MGHCQNGTPVRGQNPRWHMVNLCATVKAPVLLLYQLLVIKPFLVTKKAAQGPEDFEH